MQKINQIKKNISLVNYTTIKVGGYSDYFAEPSNIKELIYLIKWAKYNNLECFILGAGSNTLLKDITLKKLTICTRRLKTIKIDPETNLVHAQCGALLPNFSTLLAKSSLIEGEWAVGIPGTIGGAIFMNAGTGNNSISNNLISVKVIDPNTLEIVDIDSKDIEFNYRFSSFQENKLIILEAKFLFRERGNKKDIINNTKNILTQRKMIHPYHLPSFGSVFKNPSNHFAGKLIEESGLKGLAIGGAEISRMHANFIVNRHAATSDDVLGLIMLIQKKVLEKKGILLHPEVRMIGFDYP